MTAFHTFTVRSVTSDDTGRTEHNIVRVHDGKLMATRTLYEDALVRMGELNSEAFRTYMAAIPPRVARA